MKDYKRLTGEKGSICDAEYCENDDCLSCAATINYDRLADLEDKIESGELCEREEVRKETAREILEMLYKQTHNYYPSIDSYCVSRKVILVKDLEAACKKYGIELEDEE